MTHRDVIRIFLDSATGQICDDCLSNRTGIKPRQTVNLNCNRLAKANQVVRSTFSTCHYCQENKVCNTVSTASSEIAKQPVQPSKTNDAHKLWYWEGNVQEVLAASLIRQGWVISSVADTAAKSAGKDIVAERDGRTLWVSVKGYPRGTQKTNPPTQARHWFSHAVFDLVRYRDESDSAELALGLPDGFVTYQNLAERITWLRSHLPMTIFWINERGEVKQQ